MNEARNPVIIAMSNSMENECMNEMNEGPLFVVIAGPNGAGKTTASGSLLRDYIGIRHYVNADIIAQGLSGFAGDLAAIKAGEIMLERLHELANARENFAFETTLASRSIAAMAKRWIAAGYRFDLIFITLASPELAFARVQARVQAGGHMVPRETVLRRYQRGLLNFFSLYQPIADTWKVYTNSEGIQPSLIASGSKDGPTHVADADIWQFLEKQYGTSP